MTALHGFLGLPSDWDQVACASGAHKPDWTSILAEIPVTPGEADLFSLAGELNRATTGDVLLGYSMGGRIALHMLLAEGGERWRKAIIVSAAPGLANPAERMARLDADGRWARRFRIDPWDEVVADWNGQAVFATDAVNPLARGERQFDRLQLSRALLRGSVSRQEDLRPRLAELDVAILWVAGERDSKYAELARECAALNPRFRCAIVPGAGHRVPWTGTEKFCAEVQGFLAE